MLHDFGEKLFSAMLSNDPNSTFVNCKVDGGTSLCWKLLFHVAFYVRFLYELSVWCQGSWLLLAVGKSRPSLVDEVFQHNMNFQANPLISSLRFGVPTSSVRL